MFFDEGDDGVSEHWVREGGDVVGGGYRGGLSEGKGGLGFADAVEDEGGFFSTVDEVGGDGLLF